MRAKRPQQGTQKSKKTPASSLTEVWIGVGFFALAVIGVVAVFGDQLAGAFSSAPPAAVTEPAKGAAVGNPKPTRDTTKTAPKPAPAK